MNLSRKWLDEFVQIDVPDRQFAEAMTLSGSKVEGAADLGAEISNVVVGRILSLERHPDSDHMWVCQVDAGQAEPLQIVTGAQNVKENDLVPVALDGSTLPGGKEIHAGKLRGELSNGMLCSFAELGLDQRDFPAAYADGIWILSDDPELTGLTVGQDIQSAVGLDDHVVEFEITPNRPDCLSVIGLAREAAATFDNPLTLHAPEVKGGADGVLADLLDVDTPDADLVPRYTARMVRNVKIAPSPKWMRERLRAMGVRPINNIVDITNYVMLEYGQPMHAFDYRYVNGGKIIVRRASEGETLTTLDGREHRLNANHLVIADEGRAVGLAGIMGGLNSEIVDDTADVVFESACFDGTCIRKGALALGMRTEASAKFEKGLDPMNTLPAVNRACELVELLGAGQVVDGVIDILNCVPRPAVLTLEPDKINALLGTSVPENEMIRILRKLDFAVEGDQVTVPSWRGDVRRMADLAEEVARFHGYNSIPSTLMRGQTTQGGWSPTQKVENKLGEVCRACGYSEIITYSFISPAAYDKILWKPDDPHRRSFKILNPLGEDTSIMRTTTLPSMLEVLGRNWNNRNKAAWLYELGRIYMPKAPSEPMDANDPALAGSKAKLEGLGLAGLTEAVVEAVNDLGKDDGLALEAQVLTLGAYGDGMDFFTLKGTVEAVLKSLRARDIRFEPCTEDPSYHPGRCACVYSGDDIVGVLGQIHPQAAKNFGVDGELYCAELSFDELLIAQGPDPEYAPLPRFPAVTRDIAVVCDESVTVGALENAVRRGAKGLLKEVSLFDVYRGRNLGEGKKSVAFSLVLRADDRSLTSEEADEDVKSILETLEKDCGAVLR